MIRNAVIVFKEIDIRNYFIKGILFSPSPYQYVAVCVFYDADDLTQLTSWIVSAGCFAGGRSVVSSSTSTIRLAEAADMEIMTKAMLSIIRAMRMFMMYPNRALS